jgi:hypothetical protein
MTDQPAPVPPPEAVEAARNAHARHEYTVPNGAGEDRTCVCGFNYVAANVSFWQHKHESVAAAVVAALGHPDQDALARAWAEGKTAGLEQAADHVRTGHPNIRTNPYGRKP